MKFLLVQILAAAARSMWTCEPTLGRYSRETAEHELNLAFHYATELRGWLPWLDCDFDVTKLNFDRDRPDIIFHRRQGNALNYLVVEVKRARYRQAAAADLTQIREKWFQGALQYRFGASVILDEDASDYEISLLERARQEDAITAPSREVTIVRHVTDESVAAVRALGDRILEEERGEAGVDARLVAELDRLWVGMYERVTVGR